MSQYTIISATNREDNNSKVFADYCLKTLEDQGLSVSLFNLEEFLPKIANSNIYDFETSPMREIVEKYLNGVNKLIFVLPEYNGSYPGVLKLFIDSIKPVEFWGKKAGLIGISSGHSGNARGLDHLTSVLHYVKVDVFFHKLPIASIDKVLEGKNINDQPTLKRISRFIEEFKAY